MKVSVTTVDENRFEIDVTPEDTVLDMKRKIESVLGAENLPAENIVLLYNGNFLTNDQTVGEILDTGFFLLMRTPTDSATLQATTSRSSNPSSSVQATQNFSHGRTLESLNNVTAAQETPVAAAPNSSAGDLSSLLQHYSVALGSLTIVWACNAAEKALDSCCTANASQNPAHPASSSAPKSLSIALGKYAVALARHSAERALETPAAAGAVPNTSTLDLSSVVQQSSTAIGVIAAAWARRAIEIALGSFLTSNTTQDTQALPISATPNSSDFNTALPARAPQAVTEQPELAPNSSDFNTALPARAQAMTEHPQAVTEQPELAPNSSGR